MKPAADPRPILPFRVHFDHAEPIDVSACDAREARECAETQRPGYRISKIKIVRDSI